MKVFFVKFLAFLLLPFLLAAFVILRDPLKVWFEYVNYYENQVVDLNRGLVCFRIYDRNKNVELYDSFILGSSRSLAFKTNKWIKHLNDGAIPFHFDASGESIYGILHKLKYITKQGGQISNALVVLDELTMVTNCNRTGHLFVSPPQLTNESWIAFHTTFLRTVFNTKFLLAFTDYSMFRTYRPYMESFISKLSVQGDEVSGDLWYASYDSQIRKDSLQYYSDLISSGVFYDRGFNQQNTHSEIDITKKEMQQLLEIKGLFNLHGTDYRIVISPLYDQIPLDESRVELLEKIFGSENVFDFSGVNELTEPIGNYYESSHYRPHVADEIMDYIYD